MSKIETNKIDSISGTSTLKIGETNATTLDFDTGITSVTNIPAALTNTPAFSAGQSSNQTISNETFTKLNFQTEHFDTDNAFDNTTNYRFTVPTGKAGKYFFNAGYLIQSGDNKRYISYFYKNGSRVDYSIGNEITGSGNSVAGTNSSLIIDLAVDDYIEFYVYHSTGSSKSTHSSYCYFAGYKLIG